MSWKLTLPPFFRRERSSGALNDGAKRKQCLLGKWTADELQAKRQARIRPDDVAYLRAATGDSIIYSPYAQRTEDVKGENQVYEGANILGASATLFSFMDEKDDVHEKPHAASLRNFTGSVRFERVKLLLRADAYQRCL